MRQRDNNKLLRKKDDEWWITNDELEKSFKDTQTVT